MSSRTVLSRSCGTADRWDDPSTIVSTAKLEIVCVGITIRIERITNETRCVFLLLVVSNHLVGICVPDVILDHAAILSPDASQDALVIVIDTR